MHRIASCCLLVMLAAAVPVAAQTTTLPAAAVPPVNVMLPNYNGVAIGEIGGLEANAFLARANDSSAAWYNPAGLSLAKQTSVSGSASLFQYTSVTPQDFTNGGSRIRMVPSMVGFVMKDLAGYENMAGGLSVATVNSWAQAADGERNFLAGNTNERVMYSSMAEMSGWMFDAGVAFKGGDKWRVGGTFDVQLTTTNRAEMLSDQLQTPSLDVSPGTSHLSALTMQAHGSSWLWHMRVSGGFQYDVTPEVHIGIVMRTPGFKVANGGSYNHEGMSQTDTTTTTASFFEPGSNVDYRLPFEFKFGAAWIGERAQVEADVLTYQGTGAYPALTGTPQWTIRTDPGTSAPVRVQQLPFDPPIVDFRSVVNLAIGGQYNLSSDGKWKVHGGWAMNNSPVGDADTYFTKVDLNAFTGGVSLRKGGIVASGALRYETGKSGTLTLRTLQNGTPITTSMRVSNFGIIYNVSLQF